MRRSPLKRHTPLVRAKPLGAARAHADGLLDKLARTLYAPPEWGFVPEVSNHAGPGAPEVLRRADAIARHFYPPGGGYRFHGFELKTSRSDWLRELRDPEKCAPIALFCSSWYLVTPAPYKNVVNRRELPDRWGLIEVGTGRPEVIVLAEEREAEPPTPGFEAALFRAALARGERAQDGEAPVSPIVRLLEPRQAQLGCGHLALVPLLKQLPRALPCFSCEAGLPPDRAVVRAALRSSTQEERDEYREILNEAEGLRRCGCTDPDPVFCMKASLERLGFPHREAACNAIDRPCSCSCHGCRGGPG